MNNLLDLSKYFFKLASRTQTAMPFLRNDYLTNNSVFAPLDYPGGWNCPGCGKQVPYDDRYDTSFYIYDVQEDKNLNLVTEKLKNEVEEFLNEIDSKEKFIKSPRVFQKIQEIHDKIKYNQNLKYTEIYKENENLNNKIVQKLREKDKTIWDSFGEEDLKEFYDYIGNDLKKLLNDIISSYNEEKFEEYKDLTKIYKKPYCLECYESGNIICEFCHKLNGEIHEIQVGTEHQAICEKCGEECPDCNDWFEKGELEGMNADGEAVCNRCSENYSSCDECGEIVPNDELLYDEDAEAGLCRECFGGNSDLKEGSDHEWPKDINPEEFYLNNEINFYPIDRKIIEGNILPVLNAEFNKGKDKVSDQEINKILSKIQKSEAKKVVEQQLKNGVESAIDYFNENVNLLKNMKMNYPNLSGWKPLPVVLKLERGKGNLPVLVMELSPDVKGWADSIFPGAYEIWDYLTSSVGHHSGALGYARFSINNGVLVVDNLQTDLDKQNYAIKLKIDKILPGSEEEEKISKIAGRPVSKEEVKKIMNFWFNLIDKNWAPTLLNEIRNLAKNNQLQAYLTTFEMQQKKWKEIPERNEDIYDRLPEKMDFPLNKVRIRPEDLKEKDWEMHRIAKLTTQFEKLAIDS